MPIGDLPMCGEVSWVPRGSCERLRVRVLLKRYWLVLFMIHETSARAMERTVAKTSHAGIQRRDPTLIRDVSPRSC